MCPYVWAEQISLSLPIHMGSDMNKKINYYPSLFTVSFQNTDVYVILIEAVNEIPIRSYVMKITQTDIRFSMNSYTFN